MQVWIQDGDILLVSLREYQDDVADIVHKYYRGEARSLVALEEIPESGNHRHLDFKIHCISFALQIHNATFLIEVLL